MDYQNTLKYLYESVPMFQQIGGKAYKPGLDTTHRLDEYFDYPHRQFKTIHIAGTNGKGSCSHTIAAVLQSAGYRVGLYTSPHLVDFRERIRVNGEMMPEGYVVRFVEDHRSFFEPLHPSFFELTTAIAFRYFADQKVDVAVVEVGMGGRLDCTNIIRPDLCVITNIGFDHMLYLGDTLTKIATEKAGIIKEGVPVVIGRAAGEVRRVFALKAKEMGAPILFAEDLKERYRLERKSCDQLKEMTVGSIGKRRILDRLINERKDTIVISTLEPDSRQLKYFTELTGDCQFENSLTILCALLQLEKCGYRLKEGDYLAGFANVCELTGLMGRWQKVLSSPEMICDTGHNVDGMEYICAQLSYIHETLHKNLHIVFGMVDDKDIGGVLRILPKDATYYFTKASVKRALAEGELMKQAEEAGLKGMSYATVVDAVRAAKEKCPPQDFIFVGGSSFIVADLLANRDALDLD